MTTDETAVVFDVQRFSIHDGPGIRTVVFFKGCGMKCAWCQNPEAVRPKAELAYYADRCLSGCRLCLGVCAENAIDDDIAQRVDFDLCTVCGKCVDVCPANALVTVGCEMTADELLAEVVRDLPFYEASGGGVTLSGGEPVLHSAFLQRFLPAARQAGVGVALETAGHYPFDRLQPLLPYLDLVLFDVKLMDPARHEHFTGRGNAQIHTNLKRLLSEGVPVQIRMPVVPGYNTGEGDLEAIAGFLGWLEVRDVTLLPYNHLWEAKLPHLATDRVPLGIVAPQADYYRSLCSRFADHGVHAHM